MHLQRFFPPTSNTYQPISPEPDGIPTIEESMTRNDSDGHFRWAAIVCVLATLVNCAILFYASYIQPHPYEILFSSPRVAKKAIRTLRRPSQFIGFDKLDQKLLENKTFINFPLVLTQVDKDSPNTVLWAVPGRKTGIGTVFPNRKQVRITQTVSSVAQFRVLEYGMELCEINIALPIDSFLETNLLSECSLDIWKLKPSTGLDPAELTHNNRPSRLERLDTIGLRNGLTWARNITCETESLLTLELAASRTNTDTCFIEWEQDREMFPAVYIKQYSTAGGDKDQI